MSAQLKGSSIPTAGRATLTILIAISFCHMLNDMMQSLLPAIYPILKSDFDLSFTQIGLITLVYQITASLLQPIVGYMADRRSMPYSLSTGMAFTFSGLLLLSVAHSFPLVLLSAALIGMGSSVFHPESSRVARMASGGRHGFAQSLFQVGGNFGSAIGPLLAALVVMTLGQGSIAIFSLAAMLGMIILWKVGRWYGTQGQKKLKAAAQGHADLSLPRGKVAGAVAILLTLIFSKYFYLASITSYFTFYLVETFGVSVQAAQIHLFIFLGAVAVGTFAGGPLGDRFGRKYVIWFSILGALPFTLMLPHANLFWTGILSAVIGVILASAFSAILVYAQELMPGRIGMVSGLFFGFAFGMGGIGAAVLGVLADKTSIGFVYSLCAFLPAIGLLTALLADMRRREHELAAAAQPAE
ncbi:MFS transporter [Iodidimonas sp. SYSU 1G8]|uniref:MFS transporter n=1 Tax=Iodidimonas sp. SYSU 1G8 TaxID=3133967 RepID=UPI0031FEB6C4